MKKGLLTVLAASLVFVGCQNYDDQFDDLNAQISALKSQVDGLSSLSGQVASLSGTISGLSAGVNAAQAAAAAANAAASAITTTPATDLTGLEASLATLQTEVDDIQASLATAVTAADIATLQAELDGIEADVDELLATSNIYTGDLTISSASTLDAADAQGNNINIVNGTVTITQTATMDATKLQTVIDKIFTVTGNYTYTAGTTNVTAMTHTKLASTGDLTLKVNGPIDARALVTAGTLTLDNAYISKVTSINLDLLTTVTEIQTDSGGTDNIVFTSATDVQLGALASYPGAGSDYGLTITTKADATLDIGSLDDVKTDGTAAPVALTLNGPKDVTISNMTAYAGSLSLTNIENATITGFKGPITVNGGVENITMTDVEDFAFSSATGLKTVTLDVDKASDPALTATVKAPSAYGAAVSSYTSPTPSLAFASMTNLTSVTLTGFYDSVSFTELANLATIDIDVTTGDLTIDDNDNLTSVDVTGSEIGNVTVKDNDGIATVELDHTTDLNFHGATADRTYVTHTITGNTEMTSLTSGADKVMTLAVTGNTKLATVNFAGLTDDGTATSSVNPTVDVYSNALVASLASDTDDGLSQYAVDGTNDATDLGSYTTTSGMETLKAYLTVVAANVKSDAGVHFDTVSLHTIATDAGATGETEGDQNSGNALTYATNGGEKTNWVGAVLYMTASDYVAASSVNPTQQDIQAQKRAWLLDVSAITAGTTTISLRIDGTQVLHTGSAYATFAAGITFGNDNLLTIVNGLKTTSAVSRAADLGATLDVYIGGNSAIPSVTLKTGSTEAANFEGYTDAQITTLFNTHGGNVGGGAANSILAAVNTYDQFTYTVGGNSVTVSITIGGGVVSYTGATALAAVASAIAEKWNSQFGTTSGASKTLSFWSDSNTTTANTIGGLTLRSKNSGSRAYGQTVAFSHSYKAGGQMSTLTSGVGTYTFVDWLIGTDDKQLSTSDNTASDKDIIISLEETVAETTAINSTAVTITLGTHVLTAAEITELTTSKTKTGALSGTLAGDIFENDAGIYGSISSGGAGDVRSAEAADDGIAVVTAATGTVQQKRTRIHWLG